MLTGKTDSWLLTILEIISACSQIRWHVFFSVNDISVFKSIKFRFIQAPEAPITGTRKKKLEWRGMTGWNISRPPHARAGTGNILHESVQRKRWRIYFSQIKKFRCDLRAWLFCFLFRMDLWSTFSRNLAMTSEFWPRIMQWVLLLIDCNYNHNGTDSITMCCIWSLNKAACWLILRLMTRSSRLSSCTRTASPGCWLQPAASRTRSFVTRVLNQVQSISPHARRYCVTRTLLGSGQPALCLVNPWVAPLTSSHSLKSGGVTFLQAGSTHLALQLV